MRETHRRNQRDRNLRRVNIKYAGVTIQFTACLVGPYSPTRVLPSAIGDLLYVVAAIQIHREAIMKLINTELENIKQSSEIETYQGYNVTVGDYLKHLHRIHLWPLPDKGSDLDFRQLVKEFKRNLIPGGCHHGGHYCPDRGLSQRLKSLAAIVDDKLRGLCLHCVKEGRQGPSPDNCMAFVAAECCTSRSVVSVPSFFPCNDRDQSPPML